MPRIKEISVRDIPDDYDFISDSQDVKEIKEYFGITKRSVFDDMDSFFVKTDAGGHVHCYAMYGIVPSLHKTAYQVY